MSISELINEIVRDWAYKVDDGMPNPNNPIHVKQLGIVLNEMGLSHIKNEILEGLKEADSKQFTNPVLNKSIKYKNNKGEDKEGIVGNLLRLPKDNPGRVAAEKMLPPEGSPERDGVNKDLGGEGQPKKDEKPAADGGEEKPAAGGGEEEKAKAAQAMFDPKNDPAMASRLDREKEANAKLAQADKEDNKAEKSQEPKKGDDFKPIEAADVQQEIPQADPETFGGGSDIPDGVPASDLEQFNTDINKVAKQVSDAKAKGEKAPDINLCDVTIPGTNLYCDDNLGIKRDAMPQFKGKAVPGSKAADMPLDKNGEVDTEPVFKEMLKQKGIKTLQTEVPADKLKATQSELGGDKVVGMMGALEKDPNHPSITAPIYVSRDGYVIDGHHRWAAVVAHNAQNPDNQIPMKTTVLDMDIKDAIPMANKFAEDMGIAAKKQGETTGNVSPATSMPPEPPADATSEKKSLFQKQKDRVINGIKKWTKDEKEFFDRGGYEPGSEPRRSFGKMILDKAKGVGKAIVHGLKHEWEIFKTAGEGIYEAATNGGRLGVVKREDGTEFHWKDTVAKGPDGKYEYEEYPDYEVDSHGHAKKGPDGNYIQKVDSDGNPKTKKRPKVDPNASEEEKKLFLKSYNDSKYKQKCMMKAGKAILITGLTAAATGGLAHGGVAFLKHVAVELVPHVTLETVAIGTGKAAIFAGAAEMNMQKHLEKWGSDFMEKMADTMTNKEIPMDVMAKAVESYNKEKQNSDESPKEEPKMKEENLQLAHELMLEMIYGFIDEAKVSPKGSTQKSVEDELVLNPDTGKQIKVKTALTYDKQHPSYKAAMKLVKKGNKKDDTPTVQGAGMYDDDYAKNRGASKPVSKSKAVDKKGEDDTPKLDLKKVEKVSNELYGSNTKGPLIQNSPTSDAALKNGYTEGEWWVAPGNAGSNFNENMSNEAACILQKYPDLTEEELAMVIFRKARGTKLAAQQSDAAIKSKNRIKVPEGLSKEEQVLYKNAVITARSGRAKYNRSSEGAKACREQVGFGPTASVVGYGGTSKKDNTPEKVKTDRDNMLAEVDSAKNCYIYDDETGKVYKIEKENLKNWIKSSGGGENAADTVVLTKDKNGNLIYDGWSDKKTLADLQANGTLYNDMIQSGVRVEEMIKDGQISSADANKARKIIEEGGNEIKMIERGYSTISSNHSKYHLGLSPQEFKKMEELVATNPDTKKHYKNWNANVDKVVAGQGKSDAKSVAIAEEISGVKRKKSKEELQADAFVQDTLDKYGEDNTAGLLKNPEIEDSVKQQIRKALDAGKKGRTEYMNWFNQTWLGDKKNKQAIKSVSPFKILNNVQIKSPNVVTENERKVIDRGAVAARDSYKSSGTKLPKTLDTQGALEAMRKKAFETQRGIFEKLSKIKAKTMNGAPTTAAAALGFKDAVAALHLDKIDLPKDENDEHQILKRSTNLVMEGIRVSPKTIKDCLGVTDSKDLEKHFVVDFNTEKFIKNKEGFVTGKSIAIYLVDKNKQRREISPKVFRPKQGPQAKTANTLAWSDDMQKCFDSKNNK
jgi:hypothetical protein